MTEKSKAVRCSEEMTLLPQKDRRGEVALTMQCNNVANHLGPHQADTGMGNGGTASLRWSRQRASVTTTT